MVVSAWLFLSCWRLIKGLLADCRGWEDGAPPINRTLARKIVVPFGVRADLSGPALLTAPANCIYWPCCWLQLVLPLDKAKQPANPSFWCPLLGLPVSVEQDRPQQSASELQSACDAKRMTQQCAYVEDDVACRGGGPLQGGGDPHVVSTQLPAAQQLAEPAQRRSHGAALWRRGLASPGLGEWSGIPTAQWRVRSQTPFPYLTCS